MALTKLSPKDPSESVVVTFDFSNLLDQVGGEILTTAIWTVSVISGIDASPQNLLSGTYTLKNYMSMSLIKGGISGVNYMIQATATTSYGQVLLLSSSMLIQVQS